MEHHAKKRFLEAYDEYADAIYRHCFLRVYSKEKAQDLVQEAFMKTWVYMNEGSEARSSASSSSGVSDDDGKEDREEQRGRR